ncbi:dihydrodipicolinate synthase family protein [Aliidongia dinghuensis]|uniref:Dihydrodipicolinate synthase family protein n=1 Tax=Aliidongia dinghuensis TaxID=1867774 RepID=A0A8J2Z0Y4_9PROT|nr:dihydrodipicolinate synthase family protein [Aliidongia dinghuensis]GGF44539.1 dihydrodipicolinate synthase family protein [Aliidongia dinghuensis]
MTQQRARFGLSAAMTTPFTSDGSIDLARAFVQARWCLMGGCSSVTLFGTTGEGSSIGLDDRTALLAALSEGGITGDQIVGAVAAASIADAAAQMRQVLAVGCKAVLLPPPFYFKGVGDDGLFAWFAQLFERLGGAARGVLLYNIPSVTAVPLTIELVGRLRTAFPEVVVGVKDSSGDWAYTQRLLAAHRDLAILIGDERYLAEGVRLGGEGAISGLANICPDRLRPLALEGHDDQRINALVEAVLAHPVIPAVKALVAHRTADVSWRAVRPPLMPLGAEEAVRLAARYDALFAAAAA